MKDTLNREISYLRLSVTDRCDLRCKYCMPETGIKHKDHSEILSYEEMLTVISVCAGLGITKVRLTGGEPLVREGLIDFIRRMKQIDGIQEIKLTTNGIKLAKYADELKQAGVDRINISLDSLQSDKFHEITRCGRLEDVLAGIRCALEVGFERIKVNMVVMGGVNDDEIPDFVAMTRDQPIDIRFIELMPIGQAAGMEGKYVSSQEIKAGIPGLEPHKGEKEAGPAEYFTIKGHKGRIGFINPVSSCFCDRCNRIRLTADGKLLPCLHSDRQVELKPFLEQNNHAGIEEAIRRSIDMKPEKHGLGNGDGGLSVSDNKEYMSRIGG